MAAILIVDNYDSFVYNIVSYLAELGAQVTVRRNDDPQLRSLEWLDEYDGLLLSPGPGTPEDAGACIPLIKTVSGRIPIFGVCLGLQAIAVAFGGVVKPAPEQLHGKTSLVAHDGLGVFVGLPNPFMATRYHSLAINPDVLPAELEVTASTDSEIIMAVRHRQLPIEAVQFHPESVLTECGYQLLANWLVTCGDSEAPARAIGLSPLIELS